MAQDERLDAVVLAGLRSETPVGARTIWRQVLRRGFDVSESTVSRLLNELDSRGLTVAMSNKGRVLSEQGRKRIEVARVEEQRRRQFAGARSISSADELLDLLEVRRGVERVAVRAAALRATPAEVARLRIMSQGAEDIDHPHLWYERIGFHKYIGHVSHNKAIRAISDAIFEDKFDPQERAIVLIGRASGTLGDSGHEHHLIAQAIASRNPDGAEAIMLAHLDRMIREIESYMRRESREVLDQLFSRRGTENNSAKRAK